MGRIPERAVVPGMVGSWAVPVCLHVLSRLPEAWATPQEVRRQLGEGNASSGPQEETMDPTTQGWSQGGKERRPVPTTTSAVASWLGSALSSNRCFNAAGLGPRPWARALSPALAPPLPLSKPPTPTRPGTSASSQGATQDGQTTQSTRAASRGARGSARARAWRAEDAPLSRPAGVAPLGAHAHLPARRAHGGQRPPP